MSNWHAHVVTLGFALLLVALFGNLPCAGQTASTGALLGELLDPSGRAVAGASVQVTNKSLSFSRSALTDDQGHFAFALLPPGTYELTVTKTGYIQVRSAIVQVRVTESIRITIPMQVAGVPEYIDVQSNVSQLQSDSVALGRVVDSKTIQGLPLASRNFTQIVNLSPGVVSGVNNAGELGGGSGGLAQIDAGNDGIFVHGARSYDNSYEFDGVPVTDLQGSNIGSGGIPIPNPDAIREFKVQTGLYNVSFGEHAGGSVSLVTKSGTNALHGSVFEFLRNNFLNANDFFRNRTGQPRPDLKQNQFGATIGGPIRRDRLYYFGSYQGTRQTNGLASNQARIACSGNVVLPPLTNDRSPQALGALFGEMRGALGGLAVNPNGSNINPVALQLLNFKLPGGEYLIPSPEVVNPSLPLASQGLSSISKPCRFDEAQVLGNIDANLPKNLNLSVRFLWSNESMNVSFPGNGLNGTGNISGFPSDINNHFRVISTSWAKPVNQQLLNQFTFGYTSTKGSTSAQAPFSWSDVGVAAGSMNNENGLPSIAVVGSINMASAYPRTFDQERFYFSDSLTYSFSRHLLQVGGSLSRIHDDINITGVGTLTRFLSWPDFLLGLSATQNGSGLFSNVFASLDNFGLLDRRYRSWNGSLYAGDHFRATSAFSIDIGLRYERIGTFNDELGRNSSFDINAVDMNPPSTGSVAGYMVAANYTGTLPAGVIRANNDSATFGKGQNGLAPRIGFAWQPARWTSRVVVRAGYGMYFSQPTGQAFFQSVLGAPFSTTRATLATANAAATFSNPFAQPFPTPSSFPQFPAYSPTSSVAIDTVSPDLRPALDQQYGMNIQVELARNWMLEVGYFGTRGMHLLRFRSPNQALSASPSNPIRGATSNSLANIGLRTPVQGVAPSSLSFVESEGTSWYNGLEISVTKRLSKGLQLLGSYTFSKLLDSDPANVNGTSAGNTFTAGDQNSATQRWGRASSDRTHRLVVSGVYSFPSPATGLARALFGGWSTSGVLTLQSGTALSIGYTNANNVFGITKDRAQLVAGCTKANLVNPGGVENNLANYFNTACFGKPPVIGADGIGTDFGNGGSGIVNGPGQFNIDLGVMRSLMLSRLKEGSSLEFRAEFFNALNHAQFSNPNSTFGTSSFGIISGTSVNPRVGQLAIKIAF